MRYGKLPQRTGCLSLFRAEWRPTIGCMIGWFLSLLSTLVVPGSPHGDGFAASAIFREQAQQLVSLEITITGIRSDRGVIQLALCPSGTGFPDCGSQALHTAALPIKEGAARVAIADLPRGSYAVSVFHDGNANGKLDTLMGIPREGYGFSNNPPFRPRAPRFDECEVRLESSATVAIRLRYLA